MTDDTAVADAVDAATDAGGGDDWEAALAEQAGASGPHAATADGPQEAPLETLHDRSSAVRDENTNLEAVLDIPVTLSVEIGSTKVSIRNLLQLNQGSVVELDRLAGEPLDVLVNGTLVAHGEVVVVNEKFGIRLTDVVSAQERVRKLR
jgi:flagellar motor switch protein FliN/FliY